ncbi:hypothetical protein N665_0039s0005 [Sinapis alba]|nr:hypothetical protein N665_0039s0005 [Sinapis alba]
MNHLIVFVLISTMCFVLNEASCKKNHIIFDNQLNFSSGTLLIDCNDNEGNFMSNQLSFGENPFVITFSDYNWPKHTRWSCTITRGPDNMFYYDLQAYHSNFQRCGQLRLWIARDDGIWFTRRYWDPPGWILPWKIHK